MTKTEEFLNFLNELMEAAPEVAETANENVLAYIDVLKTSKQSNPKAITDNGKIILMFLREHEDTPMWKAKDIAEELFVSSRTVSGALRKLVVDGYVEKVGQNPTVYSITPEGKTINID